MTRLAFALLLAACAVRAGEREARIAVEAERFGEALHLAEEALRASPADAALRLVRAEAIRGIGRDLQRREGYDAALDYLEPKVDHALLAQAFGDTCIWAGEEERGLRVLGASAVPAHERLSSELWLLARLGRWGEAGVRAEALGWAEWVEYARGEAALRDRLTLQRKRATHTALVAGATLIAAWLLLWRFGRARR